jgi:hypothetical protein
MSTVVTIPLDKNPEVSDLVQDMQPGDRVYACFTIKAKDDQSLELRISEMAESRDELPDGTERDEDDEMKEPNDKEDGDGTDDEEAEESDYVDGA